MFSLRSTLSILFVCLLLFCLRLLGSEPYPAIMLPEGGTIIVNKDDRVELVSQELFALDYRDKWVWLDKAKFMRPIPVQYTSLDNFDLKAEENKGLKAKILGKLRLKARYNPGLELRKERNLWYRRKLKNLHFRLGKVKIISYKIVFSFLKKKIIEKKIVNEKIITLAE